MSPPFACFCVRRRSVLLSVLHVLRLMHGARGNAGRFLVGTVLIMDMSLSGRMFVGI